MSHEVRATYRLQLNGEFRFEDAAELVDYLAALGISHVYSSPILQALPGSPHGYDVVDHSKVSEDLGGEAGFSRLCEALERHSMNLIVDVVPNHMAINPSYNRWWWDVLENGASSRFASYFDIDWQAPEQRLRDIVLLPILGDHYGRILEAGEFQLSRSGSVFKIHYHERDFPVGPRSLGYLLSSAALRSSSETLSFIAEGLINLPRPTATEAEDISRRMRDRQVLYSILEELLSRDDVVARTVDTVVAETNADPDLLDAIFERQNYRLAFWRTAERDLGYRRFFDINSLAGLRTENPAVFAEIHALPLRWIDEGRVDGLRIDHVDGLRDPTGYLQRLRDAAPGAWIVAEKILASDERLPAEWPIAGTTGYDFLNLCNGLFVDPAGEQLLTALYTEFTGESADFEALCHEKKREVMNESLGSDLNRLTQLILEVCEHHRRHRDYTRHQLHEALRELIAYFPIYRTYARAESDELNPQCEMYVRQAVERARRSRPELGDDLFDFLGEVLLRQVRGENETELVMRLQQMTPPVMAKGVEDTAFYCFNRFISLNEVGGDPKVFGASPERFYTEMTALAREWPCTMRASSTHDTKRSEDVRARLNLLSEMPERWRDAVFRWSRINEPHWPTEFRDRNLEYHLYQTLVGAWPITEQRILGYLEKAAREAKVHTSWSHPDAQYEKLMRAFTIGLLNDAKFTDDLEAFVQPLTGLGRLNSLSQTLIKLTVPGVPDTYQGTELWSLSLVDPDNRRQVDYQARRSLLNELPRLPVAEILRRSDEGLPKLWVVRQALHLRKRIPSAFGESGDFRPLNVAGECRDHLIAYARAGCVVTLAPRLVSGLGCEWGDTMVELPAGWWTDELTGARTEGGQVGVKPLLNRFPVALLVREQ